MDKKQALVLLDDYWHPRSEIEPALPEILPPELYHVKVTSDPNYILALTRPIDLFVNFKDGIANTQIPTANWYDDELGHRLSFLVEEAGCGYLGIHCGLANIPDEHAAFRRLLKGRFLHHPPQCPVTFRPVADHPITKGVREFTITDEHYFVEVLEEETHVLGRSASEHGDNIALWAHEAGNGRVCGATPGHSLAALRNPEYAKLLQNAANWCAKLTQ